MSSTNFPPGLDALGRLFNAITGEYAAVGQTSGVSGLQSTANTSTVHPEYSPSTTYDVPQNVNFDNFRHDAHGEMRTASSVSSYQSSLAVAAKIGAKYGAYSGSVSGSWSNTVTATNEDYFATAFDTWSLYTLGFSYHDVDLTTTNPDDSETGLCISPELQKGFHDLATDTSGSNAVAFFQNYGTHLLTALVVGGQTRQDYQGSQSSFSNEQDFQVSAEAKYDAVVGSTAFQTSVSGSNTKHESNVDTYESIDVIGGSLEAMDDLRRNPSPETYSAWSRTIAAYPVFIDYADEDPTIPVWMLCADAAKKEYLQNVFNQLYGESPLVTSGKTLVDCVDGNLKWIDPPGSPVQSWNAGNTDEVLVGIGGNINKDKHISQMVIVNYSLSRDEYNVYYTGNANEKTSWEAFYMAPKGSVITGIGVARKSDSFAYLYVWYQKLNRQNQNGMFLDGDVETWIGSGGGSEKKIDPKALPIHGSGWCYGGAATLNDLQRYFKPESGQQNVITGVSLYSSDSNHGFVNMKITQASLKVEPK